MCDTEMRSGEIHWWWDDQAKTFRQVFSYTVDRYSFYHMSAIQ